MPESTEKHTANLRDFYRKFPDDTAAQTYFEGLRWNEKPMPYRCCRCRKHFSVRTGTLLADSRLPLQSRLLAIYLMTASCKGISSCQTESPSPATADATYFGGQGHNLHLKLYGDQLSACV